MKKSAFTMIELVFVIVVLGILAAIAIPKLAATRTDAVIAAGKADISSIRAAIVTERQTWLIKGESSYIPNGTSTVTVNGATRKQMDNGGLFGAIMMYPKVSEVKDGKWSATAGSGTYQFRIKGANNQFDYNQSTGTFNCTSGNYCTQLTR